MRRVLLIDNVDSFTFNIADLLHRVLGQPPTVWRNDRRADAADLSRFAAVVVGPGPGRPQVPADLGLSDLALRQREVPVLGICLGHQGLAHLAGDEVLEMATPRHGIVSPVHHDGTGLFAGLPSPFEVVRYHSLEVRLDPRSPLVPLATAGDDGALMALADPSGCRFGLQFHPESVLSRHGAELVAAFLRLAGVPVLTPFPAAPSAARVAVGDMPRRHRLPAPGARPVSLRVCRLPGPVDDWLLHERLTAGVDVSCWLDASDGRGVSVVAFAGGPLAQLLTHRVDQDPLALLDRVDALLGGYRLVGDDPSLPFEVRPGLVGYLGYELKAETGGARAHRSPHPDAQLLFTDRMVVIEHASGDVVALALVDDATTPEQELWLEHVRVTVQNLRGQVHRPAPDEAAVPRQVGPDADRPVGGGRAGTPRVGARHTEQDYLVLIDRCLRAIAAGESYEICLTNQLTWGGPVDPAALHRALRAISPVPCGSWLRLPGLDVVGASPERFVAVSASGVVQARPIKGTRPRGPDPVTDTALAADLAGHVKDRAENLMIVDLLRHDLHQVCRAGSVHVPALFEVETYATVHQLVSTVRGRLAEGMGPTDVLRSCFPGGSMTGAPKVRTMEIIDRLEGGPRGVYSGAVGWIGLNGAMDTSIVIRTATVADGRAELGVGGAITALSDPAQEYAETLTKAQALVQALTEAERSPRPSRG